ncbi:MAG: signal peptidase II [Phycisphaerae bacterium]
MSDSTAAPVIEKRVEQAAPSAVWALWHVSSHARLWVAAIGGLALDLWSKNEAFSNLPWGASKPIVKKVLAFQLSLNPGALFGVGDGFAPIFVGASVLALMFVLYLFANADASQRFLHVALGLVLAGAIGNLYDRATQEACVVRLEGPGGLYRVIGTLVNESERGITVSEFGAPDRNRRTWPLATHVDPTRQIAVVEYGPQPVVRDFIKFELQIAGRSVYPWIFNIADALLVAGVAILLMSFWSERRHQHAQQGRQP